MPNLSEKLEMLPEKIKEKGSNYAETQSTFEYLDDQKKVVLSDIMNMLSKEYPNASESKLNRLGLNSAGYCVHLQALRAARKKALTANAEYVAVKSEFEALRSISSRETAKISHGLYPTGS